MEFKELWSDLDSETRWYFESQSKTLQFKRGDYIYSQGESPQGIYFVKSGLVGLTMISAKSGKEHLLRFFRQSQFFGHRSMFSKEGYHGNAVALEATSIKFVPKDAVLSQIAKNKSLLEDVVYVLSKELRRCETQHVMILENQILARVAQSIIYLKNLHPDHNWTRQEIANFCASTVSTVIKALAELEEGGYISQEGRTISILDRNGLISLQEQT
ncbi:MAG: Crp/Fnr family transcriptional regulator [Pseudobdellovibrio sp.]